MTCVCSETCGIMQFPEFLALSNKLPLALFPFFRFQDKLQAATFGQTAWKRITARVNGVLHDQTIAQVFEDTPECSMTITPDER